MTNETGITMPKGYEYSVGPSTPPPPTISIMANDYRPLLTIHPDGTVTGEIEDASEAARVFVEHLRGYFPQPTQSDALREENERLRALLARTVSLAEVYAEGTGTNFKEAMAEARAALQEQSK
jgi:hypothetical protein